MFGPPADELLRHERQHQALEPAQLGRVGEDDPAQRAAVDGRSCMRPIAPALERALALKRDSS